MDVKSAFLYGKIEEEVYVCQPPGFEDSDFPDKVYKVEKALYGLHQALRAWYETLSTYLLDNGFQRGKIDKTLFIRRVKSDILLVQVYVDDIIFGSTKKSLCIEFEKMMHKNQDKYVTEILKKFDFTNIKTASTPMETHKPLLKDADGEDVDEHLYRSMIGSLMYLTSSRPDIMFAVCACARYQVNPKVSHLHAVKRIFRYLKGCRLISWKCKKQIVVANSTTEAEYIAASNCCGQDLCIVITVSNVVWRFSGSIIAGTVNLCVAWYLLSNIDGICHPDPKSNSPWTCPFDTVFFDASVILGFNVMSQAITEPYRKLWWKRYNYILSAALDAGVAFMAILLYFTTGLEDRSVHWWGTDNPQHCDLATCPTAKGVNITGCPVF
ncbi:uncharacterized mitochondrial protein-like protein [Tanacetum coccineum]|uniref:Uncharacterized mitochondrial protein-like protein n=1 Tax=Tanacetum coccineum TaxID=301880 RepID=A0ABQ4ZAN1_9ASTR